MTARVTHYGVRHFWLSADLSPIARYFISFLKPPVSNKLPFPMMHKEVDDAEEPTIVDRRRR